MYDDDDDFEVYIYRGVEQVQATAEKLFVEEGVQGLPINLCYNYDSLRKVCLSNGLKTIGSQAFAYCEYLLGISISSTVQFIGDLALAYCVRLVEVKFEHAISTNHPHTIIGEYAFHFCTSLQRIEIPSFVVELGPNSFEDCAALVEANLSNASITKVSGDAFSDCVSLQTVSLPKTLEKIDNAAFWKCSELVTVVVPVDTKPIKIGPVSFDSCSKLANLWLPKDSSAETDSFHGCALLMDRYGEDASSIVSGLAGRFEKYTIHRMCYDHFTTMPEDLQECIEDQVDDESSSSSLVDDFGMTPFHILCSTIEPTRDLMEVLLELLPNQLLSYKDANGKRPLDYLDNNWTDNSSRLAHFALWKSMVDAHARWGNTTWVKNMEGMVQYIYAINDKEERTDLLHKAYVTLEHYQNLQATSHLELALWKKSIQSKRNNGNGDKRHRYDCRVLSGSDVVIPNVTAFLLHP